MLNIKSRVFAFPLIKSRLADAMLAAGVCHSLILFFENADDLALGEFGFFMYPKFND
jgi:hypothetical protein